MSKIIDSIKARDLDAVKALIQEDSGNIRDVDENGVSAAYHMIRTGDMRFVRYLVEYTFASFNLPDIRHRSALHEAVMTGNLEIVKYFTERVGLSPCYGDDRLNTPWSLAVDNGFDDINKYFEDYMGMKFEDTYQNPVRRGFYADPSVVRVGEDYYMVNSSFIYFPCIPISHSKDLVHWESIGHAITNPEWAHLQGLEGGRGYWAPDISYYEGRFYITATLRNNDDMELKRRQIVVSSENPEGPYTEPVFIDEDGIDPSLFTDVDGRRYMLLNRGARIFELNKEATKKISEPRLLYYGSDKRAPEGPHLFRRGDYYYLIEAEGGTGADHKITVSRSKTLMGVYEPCPYNPIMTQRDLDAPLTCCGHGKFVETQNGDWYVMYLACRDLRDDNGKAYTMLGRETCLDPVTWTADDWPIINNLRGPSVLQKFPNLEREKLGGHRGFDGFDKDHIRHFWMWSGTPEPDAYRLENSVLYLKGSKEPLTSEHAQNILVRRQPDFVFDSICETKLGVDLEGDQNYGMTGYYDEKTFFTFGIYRDGEGYSLKIFEKIAETEQYSASVGIPLKNGSVWLKVETDCFKRKFLYSLDGEYFTEVYTAENVYYLSSQAVPKGKRFTGAMVGLYAYCGDGKELYAPFESFDCHRTKSSMQR